MYVYNEDKKKFDLKTACAPAIIGVTNNVVELGYADKKIYTDLFLINGVIYNGNYEDETIKEYFGFDESCGFYKPIQLLNTASLIPGSGEFPYSFVRNYEAMDSFEIFSGRQIVKDKTKKYWATKYLENFSFGFEFETSGGYIPQMECYRNGLIPLRDGSITGLEYSTVVLSGNDGLNLLHQQLEQLRTHCKFDKECSLHIHVGGYPITKQSIFVLYKVAKMFEKKITPYMPKWTYSTRYYKANRKDYCKKLWDDVSTFEDLFLTIAEHSFNGSFHDEHPADPDRHHKWQIHSRYRWMNLVNILCYEEAKTVEFRFLRPSFDETKIIFWLLLLTGMMRYALTLQTITNQEELNKELESFTLSRFINKVFEQKDAKQMKLFLKDLRKGVEEQTANDDYFGSMIELEDYSNLKI